VRALAVAAGGGWGDKHASEALEEALLSAVSAFALQCWDGARAVAAADGMLVLQVCEPLRI